METAVRLPEEFVKRMQKMLGSESDAFFASYEDDRMQALRINICKVPVSDDYKRISPFALSRPVPWAEAAFYYSKEERPGKHPHHEAGLYYIQEPSAMSVAGMLEAKPGEIVLDLCAAPGGKTTQIAAAMHNEGILVANEIHPQRAKILSQNVERLGFRNVIVTNETPEQLAGRFEGYFDKILVDAPCSGEGMFRKDEAAREEWSPENVAKCAERQDMILDCAVRMLKPEGRLVYSTCTFAPEENEGSICRLLERNGGMEIIQPDNADYFSEGRRDFWENAPEEIAYTMRLWSHKLDGEGHYIAVLKKRDGFCGEVKEIIPLKEKFIPKDYLEFAKVFFKEVPQGNYYMFGEQLYMIPEGMFDIDKLRTLRIGWHLGEIKKNRFEPSHALALGVDKDNLKNVVALSSEDKEVYAYLKGETFNSEGENGWCVVAVDGYPLGLGKRVNGLVKNHYPKGLRWQG